MDTKLNSIIKREILSELKQCLKEYPVVTVIGPRQAGKTTLVKLILKGYDYVNLEDPEERELAENDPREFISRLKSKTIIDEIQRVPSLLSYIQIIVDEKNKNGQFILTGSHQLNLHEAITQSLAGRTAVLSLLPLSMTELNKHKITFNHFSKYCIKGFLPRLYHKKMTPSTVYSNYYKTYVERDVRQIINLKNVNLFEKFLKLLAGRVGQLCDYNSLSYDVGVDGKTINHWISILEASFVIFKLPPFFENFGKRAIKKPKIYFTDTGLLSFLLGIDNDDQLRRDPLVGNIFENLVICECLKYRYNTGATINNLYFFRDSNGNEVDLIYVKNRKLIAIEIKSASTFNTSHLRGLKKLKTLTKKVSKSYLVYGGDKNRSLGEEIDLLSFKKVAKVFNTDKLI